MNRLLWKQMAVLLAYGRSFDGIVIVWWHFRAFGSFIVLIGNANAVRGIDGWVGDTRFDGDFSLSGRRWFAEREGDDISILA